MPGPDHWEKPGKESPKEDNSHCDGGIVEGLSGDRKACRQHKIDLHIAEGMISPADNARMCSTPYMLTLQAAGQLHLHHAQSSCALMVYAGQAEC